MQQFIPQLIGTGVVIMATIVIRVIVKGLVRKYAEVTSRPDTKTNHIVRVCMIFINFIAAISLIVIWGVNPKNIFIAMSSVFAVIGVAFFAQWSILSNVTSGVIIFFTAPFHVGDFIRILDKDAPLDAYVEDIHTFYTHLRTKDGGLHLIPNTLLLQKGISIIDDEANSNTDNSF